MDTKRMAMGLHCPYCDASLDLEWLQETPLYGIARCDCYRYPILEGILILRQVEQEVVRLLETGDFRAALRTAFYAYVPRNARTRRRRIIDFLSRSRMPFAPSLVERDVRRDETDILSRTNLTFREAAYRLRPNLYADYLFQRFGNPSLVAGLAMMFAFRRVPSADPSRPPVLLDLGCGAGHSTFLLRYLFPNTTVVATDHDFVNLYLMRILLAPEAVLVCLDAEVPLPFQSGCFDGVFCMDAFHYIHGKAGLVRELERTMQPKGLWVFAHLHNALRTNITPGIPMSPAGYARLFQAVGPCLYRESDILAGFMRDRHLDPDGWSPVDELEDSDVLCMIGGGNLERRRKETDTTAALMRNPALLNVNPIYKTREDDDRLVLELQWPNSVFETECESIKSYLPSSVQIPTGLLKRLQADRSTPQDEPEIRNLVHQWVLIPLPPNYTGSMF